MDSQIIFQLFLAVFLGSLIGLERRYKGKEAGLRTYALVCLGTCLFTVISFELMRLTGLSPSVNFDSSRIIQAVATGIGFIGAGVIFRQSSGIVGLTTAAGFWATAAIGVAVGAGLYLLAASGTFLVIFVLICLGPLEEKLLKKEDDIAKH